MGDGRYYTYYQFFTTLILMILMTVSIVSLIVSFYKSKHKKKWSVYAAPLSLFILLGMMKFVEGVIPQLSVAYFLRCASAVIMMTAIVMIMLHAGTCLMNIYVIRVKQVLFGALMFGITAGIMTVYSEGTVIIRDYTFFTIDYSQFYQGIFAFHLATTMTGCFYALLGGKKISIYYKNKQLAGIYGLLMTLPLGVYLYVMYYQPMYVDLAEYWVICSYIGVINIMSSTESPHGLSAGAFERISDMVKDYIIVTNVQNEIIYMNKTVKDAPFIEKVSHMGVDEITKLFNQPAKLLKHTNHKSYIQLNQEDKNIYFNYKYRALKDSDEVMGYIMTLIDITEVLEIVEVLKDKRQQSEELNSQLKNYSEVVYHVEKEKRIGALIDEIILSREAQMVSLISKIKALRTKIDADNYLEMVSLVIDENSTLLEDVRQAVGLYRHHYR